MHDNQYTISKNAVESHWIENHLKFAMGDALEEIHSKNGKEALEILEKNVEKLRYNTSETKIIDYDIGYSFFKSLASPLVARSSWTQVLTGSTGSREGILLKGS